MSRIANAPISLPSGVSVTMSGQEITVKGGKGELKHQIHEDVSVNEEGGVIKVAANNETKSAKALAGTTRALVNNLVVGVSDGFERKIENKTFNNNRVIVREVDGETDSETADKFKIEGYPTIKLVTEDGTVYDYDARPNVETLMQFLNEVL